MTSAKQRTQGSVSSPRFYLLDFARFIAALAVVFYHFASRDAEQWSASTRAMFPDFSIISSYGYLGVQLFFIVSGFVILMSTEGRTVSSFAAARAARIFPAYWLAVVATACLRTWTAPELGDGVTFPQVLVNLTMFQVPADVSHVDDVYWTLWIEMVFYIVMACLMAMKVTYRGYTIFLAAYPALMLHIAQTEHLRLIDITGAKYFSFFALGMCLYLIHKHGSKIELWLLFAFNAAIGIRNTLYFSVPNEPTDGRFVTDAGVAIVVVAIIVLMTVLTLTPLKHRGYTWMTKAGALTYPLYLTHHYWGLWLIGLLEPTTGKWLTLAIAVAASLIVAYVIERWIERPVRPRMRHTLKKVLS